jgi:glycosyltransferase involved in cell wall biosynthesis
VEVLWHPPNIADDGAAAGVWKERIGEVDGPILLFFGNIRRYKGLHDLLAAMPNVRREVAATLIVAGHFFEPLEDFERQAMRLGVARSVRFFPGYVPKNEVEGLFEVADLVVLPYRSASQSGILAQAALAGKPVVATGVGGIPEFLGDRGVIVPPANPEALAEGIVQALTQPPLPPRVPDGGWEGWRSFLLVLASGPTSASAGASTAQNSNSSRDSERPC